MFAGLVVILVIAFVRQYILGGGVENTLNREVGITRNRNKMKLITSSILDTVWAIGTSSVAGALLA